MKTTITITGIVATAPRRITTSDGLDITTFRLAHTPHHYNPTTQTWSDTPTNWYTIACYRHLAENTHSSLTTGDRILLTGELTIRDWTTDTKTGTTAHITATALGHDLNHGTTTHTRNAHTTIETDQNPNEDDSTPHPVV